MESPLPQGVYVRSLVGHRDDRGCFTEVFRAEWDTGVAPVQWNVVESQAGVLRGVHVHLLHDDYLIILSGRASIGLKDLRRESPTAGLATVVELNGERLQALTIPPGVAHGFYFHEPSRHLYAVSRYFDRADELGCRWNDPELAIPWPITEAATSARDAAAPPLSVLVQELATRYATMTA
jgi:dTDP-4-dehydrorhamnose 3,5-epimerase